MKTKRMCSQHGSSMRVESYSVVGHLKLPPTGWENVS